MFARRCPTTPKPTQPSSVSICAMALFKMGMAALGGWQSLGGRPLFGSRNLGLGQQVLGVDEPAARLPETLGRLLLAEAVDIGALFPQTRCKAREVAVRRDETEAVEPAAVQKVHGVDHQGDVGRVLASRVGELLVRIDRISLEDVGPRLQALAREKRPPFRLAR